MGKKKQPPLPTKLTIDRPLKWDRAMEEAIRRCEAQPHLIPLTTNVKMEAVFNIASHEGRK
jgi:hypothetical protein